MIDKAVVAYRKPLDRPFFTVSLRDAAGRLLEPPADTPPGHYDRGTRTIAADHAVVLRTPLRDLPGGARVSRACQFCKLCLLTLRFFSHLQAKTCKCCALCQRSDSKAALQVGQGRMRLPV